MPLPVAGRLNKSDSPIPEVCVLGDTIGLTSHVRYHDRAPSGALRSVVERVWCLEHDATEPLQAQEVAPDGSMELVFHLGETFERRRHDSWQRQDRMLVAGQLTAPIHLRPTGRTAVIGIRFRPGGASAFLENPQHELTNDVLPMADVAPRLAARLRRVLELEDSVVERSRTLEAELARQMPATPLDPVVDAAVTLIQRSHGSLRIETLTAATGVSPRQLERRFLDRVGIPPKRLSRIIRFQRAVRLLRSIETRPTTGAELAAALGYADQAHLIRDFRAFSGHTPVQHVAAESALGALLSGAP